MPLKLSLAYCQFLISYWLVVSVDNNSSTVNMLLYTDEASEKVLRLSGFPIWSDATVETLSTK